MKRNKLPLSLLMIRGSIGKQFVIKHYKWGIIKTKFPDMSGIVASAGQRQCRNIFKEAVAYAKAVIADPVLKKAWQKRLRRRNGVYNAAVTDYMNSYKAGKKCLYPECLLKIVHKNLNRNNIIHINKTPDHYLPQINSALFNAINNTEENRIASG